MIEKYFDKPFIVGNSSIDKGIILPESQNHPLMDPSIFNSLSNPCDIQYSITGTWALMIGFAVGLPPLWNIDTGESGIGIFGLMDQGSNNGRGMIPSVPNPWTRTYAGWENPAEFSSPQTINLSNLKKLLGHFYCALMMIIWKHVTLALGGEGGGKPEAPYAVRPHRSSQLVRHYD